MSGQPLDAFLETQATHWMGHVLDLPGCWARASGRAEVIQALQRAVAEYRSWLRRHGENVLEEDDVHLEVREEIGGTGPFDPGDPAALFEAERKPLTTNEIEHRLRLMQYSRLDLLSLVRDLPAEILDWRGHAGDFSLRILLRHIGNAEEFYVSRLFEPDRLPEEWASDDELPVLEFLDIERRGAVACLRSLDEHQRSAVLRPAHFTDHPDEDWTARKVLRRFIEHEREHAQQARQILVACPYRVGGG